jgi:hypothetical protein
MSYIRHDINNNPVSPQPGSNTVTVLDNCEGWTPITYEVWNADYVARNSDNTVRTPGTYQARNSDNTVRTPAAYQRHDINNDPVDICPQGIGSDDPANAAEPDATAWVLMDGPFYNTPGDPNSGFVGGQSWRKMAPSAPVNGKTSYIYGDETVTWTGSEWQYANLYTGVIASSSSNVVYPWLATWSGNYTGAKITSAYVKTTNYPAVP